MNETQEWLQDAEELLKLCDEALTDGHDETYEYWRYTARYLASALKSRLRPWQPIPHDAPPGLVDVVADAMIEYGPDGHCDGSEKIAQAALDWLRKHVEAKT